MPKMNQEQEYESFEVLEYVDNKVIQSIKSEELKERVLSIIDKIFQRREELWGYIKYIHMVDHGERHTRNVMDLLTRFLVYSQRQLLNELTDMEKSCLIFAVWFHDVGGRGLPEQDEKFLNFLYTRGEHPWIGEEIFIEMASSFGFSDEEIHIIGEIIPAHSSKENIDRLPKETIVNNQLVRPRFLASILSFMDACDTQQRRVGRYEGVKSALKEIKVEERKVREDLEMKRKLYEMRHQLKLKEEEVSKLEREIKVCEAYLNFYREAPNHFYKHLSVKEVYFTPESVILEPNYTMRKVYPEGKSFMDYFNMALEDIRREFERVKRYFNEYRITIKEIRAYDENRDNIKELKKQLLKKAKPKMRERISIPGFYGREHELRELYEIITDEKQTCNIINVFGIGGIGKTAFVEALLLHLSRKYPIVWEVRSTEGRETIFSTPENYKIGVLEVPDVRGLMQLLGAEVKEDIEDSLINWLDNNKVILFIDDFQKLENNLKNFIKKAYNKLKIGKIIITSRECANVRCHLYKGLSELEEESCKEMIKNELKRISYKPDEGIVNLIYEKTKGHPLAVKMFVPLISKIPIEKLEEFGSIRDVRDEEEVKEFISRVFLDNIKDKQDLTVFEYLSLLKDGFNYNILRAILMTLNDERYKWKNEELHYKFLSQYMPHIISYDYKRKIFNFSHDMVKEAAYSQVENIEKSREEILEVLLAIVEIKKIPKEIEEKGILVIKEEDVSVLEEILYQAEDIMKLKGENKGLVEAASASSSILAKYGYRRGIPLMTYEYGRKALYYAEKLENWIEALEIAERILYCADKLLIPEDDARSLYMKVVNKLFPKALKLNEDHARYHYAFAMSYWASYALRSLQNVGEAELSLEKAFKEIGSRDSRKIKDELLWYDAYYTLLAKKSDVLIRKRDYEEALKVLKENYEMLEHYKDEIIRKWSEEAYYRIKSKIMNRITYLTLITAESEDDLERARKYAENSIIYASKTKRYDIIGIVNLAEIRMLLAKKQYDFERVYRDLEDCLKIFEEVGDKHGEALTKRFMAICCLALKGDGKALKFTEELMEIVEKGSNEYLKALSELTLAYIKMTSRLSDFKKGELSNEVYELIQNAYEKLENIRTTGLFIALAVKIVAKYLQNKIKYNELLNELDKIVKELENEESRKELWIMKQFTDAVKEKGDIDEDILRLKGIKLLLAL